MKSMNDFPLSGFAKISYEEFKGILQILSLYSELSEKEKKIVGLALDGMKYRKAIEKNDKTESENDRIN